MSGKATYEGLGAGISMPEKLSTASTALTLTLAQQDKMLIWNGQAAPARITLPLAEAGLTYNIFFHADAVSSATLILADDTDDFYIVDGTTGRGVKCETTVEGGMGITLYAIDSNRWIPSRFGGSSLGLVEAST